jgi:hypothetical protein
MSKRIVEIRCEPRRPCGSWASVKNVWRSIECLGYQSDVRICCSISITPDTLLLPIVKYYLCDILKSL